MPRRKAGALLPLESRILEAALATLRSGQGSFHGFGLAERLRADGETRSLTAHGTLYKALGRLEEFGFLGSTWEDAAVPGRPRRRLYALTANGIRIAEGLQESTAAPSSRRVAVEPA